MPANFCQHVTSFVILLTNNKILFWRTHPRKLVTLSPPFPYQSNFSKVIHSRGINKTMVSGTNVDVHLSLNGQIMVSQPKKKLCGQEYYVNSNK